MSFAITYASPTTPYYGGEISAISSPPSNVALDGVNYPIDLNEYRANGLRSFRDGVVASSQPSDNLFDADAGWWRYRFSWHWGEGQDVLDLEDTQSEYRYDNGVGVDPWTKYQICLLKDTELAEANASATIKLAVTDQHVYMAAGTTLKRSSDLSTWSSMTGTSGTINDLTSDGANVYACTDTAIYECVPASTAVNTITPTGVTNQYDYIHFVGNRLLASDGDILVDASGAALSTIYDHFQDAFRWTTAFTVGSRVYVGGYAGNRSQIYTTTTDDTGALLLSSEATDFFSGEQLNFGLSYGGQVVLCTSKGVRFATLGGDGTLTYGPLIDAPGSVVHAAAEGEFVWFNWEGHPAGGASGLGRLSLADFTDTLTPAYASDIYTTDGGAVDTTAVARFDNKTVFAVSGEGVYNEHATTYLTSGYLELGELYYGTVEDKSLMEFKVRTDELETGESITTLIRNGETGATVVTGTSSTVGSNGVVVDADGDQVNYATVKLTLGSDGTSSPCIRQWRGRAYPVVPSGDEWIVPLVIHRRVVVGDGAGQILALDPWTEVERLKELRRSRAIITYQEGNHAWRVRIDNYEVMPSKWTDDGDWLEVTMKLRLLSV